MALSKGVSGLSLLKMIRALRSKKAQTYILPTSFGYAFFATLFVLFAMAIGSSNNLIYLFVFFLFSTAITGMILTNRNIVNTEIQSVQGEELFANEAGSLIVLLNSQKADQASWDLAFSIAKEFKAEKQKMEALKDSLKLNWKAPNRGWVELPKVRVQSSYPFGLFGAWKVYKKLGKVMVYPERKGEALMPLAFAGNQREGEVGLFLEHREYNSGDSPRRIDWRASARRHQLLLKKFEPGDSVSFKFDWKQVEHLGDFEEKISQLTLWIWEADMQKIDYSLYLKNFKSELSQGKEHLHLCLEKLALLKPEDIA